MSQNTPNQQGRADDHGVAQNFDHEQGHAYPNANPYFAQHQAAETPDLDASAPVLRAGDVQRLNRKALVFIAGIVALLIAAAIWMGNSATAGGGERKPKVAEEEVNIPELPKGAADEQAPPPASELPPLPVEDMAEMQAMPEPPPLPVYPGSADGIPREPSLMERRMANLAGGESLQASASGGASGMMSPESYARAMMAAGGQENAQQPSEKPTRLTSTSAQPLINPDTLLLRGSYIRCVMETRIVTDVAGFTSCVVTEPVYSVNGRRLLLAKGSKISGTYENANITGPRVAVIWDRITTPNGVDINMASPGVDNFGGAGHPGDYNAHWGSRIASAMLISLISDAFKYAAAKNGPESTIVTNSGTEVVQPYESNTARAMERLANQAVDRSMNRPATVTINQGTVVNVYVAKDVDFSSVLR
jgi:type IV secretion system protein VirB10